MLCVYIALCQDHAILPSFHLLSSLFKDLLKGSNNVNEKYTKRFHCKNIILDILSNQVSRQHYSKASSDSKEYKETWLKINIYEIPGATYWSNEVSIWKKILSGSLFQRFSMITLTIFRTVSPSRNVFHFLWSEMEHPFPVNVNLGFFANACLLIFLRQKNGLAWSPKKDG